MFDLENVGQGQGVQRLLRYLSMANVKLYNSRVTHFVLSLIFLGVLTFKIFYLEKVSQGHGRKLSRWQHSMANIKIYKRYILHF